jgi:sugar phosphate isomerase/epimerase
MIMKIGVSSYSFSRLFRNPGFSLFDVIKETRKIGFDTIEFTEFKAPEGKSVRDFAGELRTACDAAGLPVSNYAVGADFLSREAARLKEQVDIAKILGSPCLRHDLVAWDLKADAGFRSYHDIIQKIAGGIRDLTEYAAKSGVKTMTENHGYMFQDSRRMEELVLAVDHPNYGLLVDMGNFMCADENSVSALVTAMPYAFHVHAKDFLWKRGTEPKPDDSWFPTRGGNHLRGTILGHGVVSVAQCIEYIKKTGYDGVISLEFEGMEEPLDAIRRGYEFLKAHC